MKIKLYLKMLPLLMLLLFSSCLSVTTVLEHKASGRGTLTLDYRISKKAVGVQKDALSGKNLIPLPVNETDFNEIASLNSGISFRNFSETEDSDYVYIQADIEYEGLDDLESFLGIPVDYTQSGNENRLELTFLDFDTQLDAESKAILASLFAEDRLVFEMSFPSAVRSSTYGNIEGRTVRFDSALVDLYGDDGFVWIVEW